MKWHIKREVLPFSIIAIIVLLAIYFYPTLPDQIPSHFDRHGNPDKYSDKGFVIFLNLALAAGLYLLLTFIPFLDPFWKRIQKNYNVFLLFRDFALLFVLFMFIVSIVAAKAGTFPTNLLGIGFGMLFILLGNYLPRLPRNFFFGIRCPWTLASEIVWRKTHILSGWLFVLAGIVMLVLSLLGVDLLIVMLSTLLPVLLFSTFVYPLFLYKKIQKEETTKVPEL